MDNISTFVSTIFVCELALNVGINLIFLGKEKNHTSSISELNTSFVVRKMNKIFKKTKNNNDKILLNLSI